MRYWPTDVLLAVEDAERHLGDSATGLSDLVPLFDSAAVTDAADVALMGSTHQYPWHVVVDHDEVLEFVPTGCVVLDDTDRPAAIRGLVFAWLFGNDVVIRTSSPEFWQDVDRCLRGFGHPLPPLAVAGHDAEVDGVRVQPPASTHLLARHVWLADAHSRWIRDLFRVEVLAGTSLPVARQGVTADEQRGRLDAKARYAIGRARRVPHYRDLPSVAGLDDLPGLPLLPRTALELNSLPESDRLSTGAPASGHVLRTGGTSGRTRYISFSRDDWENMVRESVPLFYSLGLRRGDRVVNTLFGGSLYGGLISTVCDLARMPVQCYTTGQEISVDDFSSLVRKFHVNVVLGVPSLILPLLREAKEKDPGLTVERVLYCGVPMSEPDRSWLRDQLGVRTISSILAANDGAQIGYQCPSLSGTEHHLCDDFNYVEIVDEHGTPCQEGVAGSVVITTFQKTESPLIRYLIGDRAVVRSGRCDCGLEGRTIQYLGRTDGMVKFFWREVRFQDVFDALTEFEVSELQFVASTEGRKEKLSIRVEAAKRIDEEVLRGFLAGRFDALGGPNRLHESVDPFEFTVEWVPDGGLPRSPISGKVAPVVDLRVSGAR